jgi:hypothetical protein
MSEPEKLQNPSEIVLVNQYISEFIDDFEQQIYEQKIRVSEEWMKIRENEKSDKAADSKQMGQPQHRKLNEIERISDRLRRFRADNKSKLEIIMSTNRYK